MRAIIRIIVGLAAVCIGRELSASPVELYVLAGQSNMDGRAHGADLPPSWKEPQVEVRLYFRDQWAALAPGASRETTPDGFGPELSFGRTMAERSRGKARIAIVKHSPGGTDLARDWRPGAGAEYNALLAKVTRATDLLRQAGEEPALRAFVWMQGERDATHEPDALAYQENLRAFIARVRADLKSPQLTFVMGQIQAPSKPFRNAVRDAQETIARTTPGVALVKTDDLALLDIIHFDASALLELGRRFARAVESENSPARVSQWTALPALPDAEGFAGMYAGAVGGRLIAAGGTQFAGGIPWWDGGTKQWSDAICVLEPDAHSWTVVSQKLPRRLGDGFAVGYRGELICVGGGDSERAYAEVFSLRPNPRGGIEVSPLPPLPRPCIRMGGALIGDILYILGGRAAPNSVEALRTFWALDLSRPLKERRWTVLEPWPGPARMNPIVAEAEGSLLLMGGIEIVSDRGKPKLVAPYLSDVYRYVPSHAQRPARWETRTRAIRPLAAAPSPAHVAGTRVLIYGGVDGAIEAIADRSVVRSLPADISEYDFAMDRWRHAGNLSPGFVRVNAPAFAWRGDYVIVSGENLPARRTPQVTRITAPAIHPSFRPVMEDPRLPRVLILGDSISMGYTLAVREKLSGVANVIRPPENGRSSRQTLERIDAYLGSGEWDVIHFNCGIHDITFVGQDGKALPPSQGGKIQVSLDDYERNLRLIVERLRRAGASVIWASTTPVADNIPYRRGADVVAWNEAARNIMTELGAPINDLFSIASRGLDSGGIRSPDGVHFDDASSAELAEAVAQAIKAALDSRKRL